MLTRIKVLIKKIVVRYVKYNLVGTFVFLIGLGIYAFVFPYLGEWAYLIPAVSGSLLEFSLISLLNKTRVGKMFDSCKTP